MPPGRPAPAPLARVTSNAGILGFISASDGGPSGTLGGETMPVATTGASAHV